MFTCLHYAALGGNVAVVALLLDAGAEVEARTVTTGTYSTVELRSKGPGRKGNLSIRKIISSPIDYFFSFLYWL